MRLSPAWRLLAVLVPVALTACATSDGPLVRNPFGKNQDRRIEKLSDVELYRSGRAALDSGDYSSALDFYQRLEARYPFTRYATQGQLESIFAQHRDNQNELALTGISRFIKQHPRHAAIDYVYYLRGVIYQSEIEADFLTSFLGVDSSRRSPEAARNAFDAFAVLVQRYPASRFARDGRQRMVFLRNALARHELNIAEYYLRRRAFVAASRRGQLVLQKYQGTDSVPRALAIMRQSYAELGLAELAQGAERMLKHNFPNYRGETKESGFKLPSFGKKAAPPPPAA